MPRDKLLKNAFVELKIYKNNSNKTQLTMNKEKNYLMKKLKNKRLKVKLLKLPPKKLREKRKTLNKMLLIGRELLKQLLKKLRQILIRPIKTLQLIKIGTPKSVLKMKKDIKTHQLLKRRLSRKQKPLQKPKLKLKRRQELPERKFLSRNMKEK